MRKDGEKERKEYEAARGSLVRYFSCPTLESLYQNHCFHSRGDETAAEKVLEGIDEGDIDPVGPAKGPKRGGGKKSKRKRSLVEDYDM